MVDMDGLCFVAVGLFFVFVKKLNPTAKRQATLAAECNGFNKKINFCSFWRSVSLIKKKVSCFRINSQTLIYYIHLCHLHISIRPFITKHYTLSTAGGLYIDSKFLQIRQWIKLSTPCWLGIVFLVLNISQTQKKVGL